MFVDILNHPNIYFNETMLIQAVEKQPSADFPFGDVYMCTFRKKNSIFCKVECTIVPNN